MRGERSLAGFMAYPVVPPSDMPRAIIRQVTGNAPIPPTEIVLPSNEAVLPDVPRAMMQKTKMKVAISSLRKLMLLCSMAGMVQIVPSMPSGF